MRMLPILFGVCVAMLLLPISMRLLSAGQGRETLPVGSQPYLHILLAERLSADDEVLAGIFADREIAYHQFHYLLAFGFSLFKSHLFLRFAAIAAPLAFGVLSLFFLHRLFVAFGVSRLQQNMALLALILSPPFMHTFLIAGPDAFAITLLLGATVAFVSGSRLISTVGALLFVFGASLSIFHALLVIFFLFWCTQRSGSFGKRVLAAAAIFAVLILLFVRQQPFFVSYAGQQFSLGTSLNMIISDFGGVSGLSLFYLILFFIGLVVAWPEKKLYAPFYLLVLLLVPAIAAYPAILAYACFAGVIFCGKALARFKEAAWHFQSVCRVTLFVIILGLLFSSLSYANRMKDFPPSEDLVSGLAFLDEYAQQDVVVLSAPEIGYLIEYFAQRRAFVDEASSSSSFQAAARRLSVAGAIFSSHDIGTARELLLKYHISFIVVTSDMKKGGSLKGGGLPALLQGSETFKNIYATSSVEIWEVIP